MGFSSVETTGQSLNFHYSRSFSHPAKRP
uniref:Putative Adenosylmethionine-8-amino-7-oxononanoate aminotransferase (7,8-diamino-pelargonic acid aminotransferase) (DAPA aminotransferase) n=1 Tax=mine drainage metagenome TaxID=410659 RepID=E6QAR3_9ZZZZ